MLTAVPPKNPEPRRNNRASGLAHDHEQRTNNRAEGRPFASATLPAIEGEQ
jgi:hypothetical protein